MGPNEGVRDLSGEIVNNLVESFSLFLYFFMSNICVGKIYRMYLKYYIKYVLC